jgi:hypothetical protein
LQIAHHFLGDFLKTFDPQWREVWQGDLDQSWS